tara:strand:- start:1937 stop:2812 length:876 start_codon:yes stop_codon:yes gene_type:complete
MLKTKKWIYLDLEKTGCTFLREKFFKIYSDEIFEEKDKHSPQKVFTLVPKIITIREPESYYFSLWSYGLDKKGGFYNLMKLFYPEKISILYEYKTRDSFSYFLDFALNISSRYPQRSYSRKDIRNYLLNTLNLNSLNFFKNKKNSYDEAYFLKDEWIPKSSDIYTARILSMLIPLSNRNTFSKDLKADLSYENLKNNLADYMPEVILRTASLNSDFYRYFNENKLNFLNLPEGWQQIFPLNSSPINKSNLSSSKSSLKEIDKYLSNYHKSLINYKSNISRLLLEKAEAKIN